MSARQDPVACSRTGRSRFAARLVALMFWRTVAEVSKQMLEDLVKPLHGREGDGGKPLRSVRILTRAYPQGGAAKLTQA